MLWLIPCTAGFPRSQRAVMARRLQEQAFALYDTLVDAAMSPAPRPYFCQIDVWLVKLRASVRLSHDLRLLSIGQYEHASRMLAEIGRLLGGWMKKDVLAEQDAAPRRT